MSDSADLRSSWNTLNVKMSLFSWNQYKGYFTWAVIYGVRERVFKVQSFLLPLYRPAGKLTPLQGLQTVHWVECLSTCRCRYHVVYYSKLKEFWQNAKFINGILDFTAARASGWAEVLARATGCGFGIEMTEIRDAGIPQDSREKRPEMRDQDPLSDPFTPFYESKWHIWSKHLFERIKALSLIYIRRHVPITCILRGNFFG